MLVEIALAQLGTGKTRLSADASAGATSCTVDNNDDFATNDYVVFGEKGEELTEIVILTGTTDNDQLDHSGGTIFAHNARTPVREIKYNQVKVYSASSKTGSYSLLTTLDLTPDEEVTTYDDTTGTSNTWYKVKYYNETTDTLSSFSAPVQGTGYTEKSLKSMTDEVLEEYGDPNSDETPRTKVRRYLRAGVRNLTKEIIKAYPDYRTNYTTQSLTADTATYDLPTRFLGFKRITVNYSGSNADDAYKVETFESEEAGYPDTTYQKADPRAFFRAEQFGLRPTPDSSSGYAFLWYWDYPEKMTDDDDEHGLPYGARDLLVPYALYRLWKNKNQENSKSYFAEFLDERKDYLDFVGQSRQTISSQKVEVKFGSDLYVSV